MHEKKIKKNAYILFFFVAVVFCCTSVYAGAISKDNRPIVQDTEGDDSSVYIPKNLEECFVELKKNLPKNELEKFKNMKEDEATANAHLGLGMWIRNEWIRNRKGGSEKPLKKYFNDIGVFHPDDMSGIILTSFHRHLNNRDIKLDEQIRYYKDYWEKLEKDKK